MGVDARHLDLPGGAAAGCAGVVMQKVVTHRIPAGIMSFGAVRIALGLLLLSAAGLKGHQLATEPVVATAFLDSRWFLIGVVEFELFFGLWLLAGLYPKWTWAAALFCFALFAGVSLWKALSGEGLRVGIAHRIQKLMLCVHDDSWTS